mmetsp:Transcript_82749/g.246872  ORF Transcript_82749/g.246872 Transcript_82749/m.246872 type:complete len:201 (-) Transcript_82749:360-962(-)
MPSLRGSWRRRTLRPSPGRRTPSRASARLGPRRTRPGPGTGRRPPRGPRGTCCSAGPGRPGPRRARARPRPRRPRPRSPRPRGCCGSCRPGRARRCRRPGRERLLPGRSSQTSRPKQRRTWPGPSPRRRQPGRRRRRCGRSCAAYGPASPDPCRVAPLPVRRSPSAPWTSGHESSRRRLSGLCRRPRRRWRHRRPRRRAH